MSSTVESQEHKSKTTILMLSETDQDFHRSKCNVLLYSVKIP